MQSDLVNMRNVSFLLWDWLDLGSLLERPRYAQHSRDEIESMVELTHQIAANELAPHMRASDTHEPSMDADGNVKVQPDVARAVKTMAEAGLFATVFDEELGGLQLPNLVHNMTMGLVMAGGVGAASFILLTTGNARLIAHYGSEAQVATFAVPQIAGTATGTMCLSESQAGSSLGDIRTKAEADGQDELGQRFRITGNKMWISSADHDASENIVHLVLAKIPDENGNILPGARGISLFIVPKLLPDGSVNDLTVVGLNHKMGQRGLPNCAFNLGDGRTEPEGRAGAIGWLIGEPGQGLTQMFQMMNEARIAVGLCAAILANRGYQMALNYARERVQGRLRGGRDPVAIIDHADVRHMLLTQKAIAEGALALVLYSAHLLDEEQTAPDADAREEAAALLALLTPMSKSWPSEMAQESLHLSMQIFGGAGYTRDFEVEQLYRDNRLNPIHEGTTGIHGIDLVGRKIRRDGGATFALLQKRVVATVEAAQSRPELAADAEAVQAVFAALAESVALLLAEPDEGRAMANATAFLHALGQAVVGWLWLDQALLCDRALEGELSADDRNFHAGKVRACHHFIATQLPRVRVWLEPVNAMSELAASMPTDQF